MLSTYNDCARLVCHGDSHNIGFDIIEHIQSLIEAWKVLKAYFEPNSKSEKRGFHRTFNPVVINSDERPESFMPWRVDRVTKPLEGMTVTVAVDDVDITTNNALFQQCGSSAKCSTYEPPTRDIILRVRSPHFEA